MSLLFVFYHRKHPVNNHSTILARATMNAVIIWTLLATLLFSSHTVWSKRALKKPTVLVGILIRNKAHTLPYFLSLLEKLDYPKDRMALCIRSDNNIDNSIEILEHWLKTVGHEYHAVDSILDDKSSGLEDENGIADWPISRFLHLVNLREEILNIGRKTWADYIFMLDADVLLTNPSTLDLLVSKRKSVVAPLVKSDGMYSNFWAGMGQDYYYVRTERYEPIFSRREIGCHSVPMIHSVVLVDLRTFESDRLTYNFEKLTDYQGPKDDIITFAIGAALSNVSLYVCNDQVYGYITVPLDGRASLNDDVDQLTNLKLEILGHQDDSPSLSDEMRKFVEYPKRDRLGFDKIFMINLERRPEKRARMERCFRELGIEAETIGAVDGRTLDEEALKKWGVNVIPNYMDPYHKRPMTMGEIGCFLSHYTIWKNMLDKEYERIMILEDDVRFEPFFRQKIQFILKEVETLGLEWDLIYLGRKRLLNQEEPLVNGSKFLLHPSYSYWTIGYLLSASGVKKLLEARPLENMIPVDEYLPILFDRHPGVTWKEYFPKRDLVAFSVNPLVIYPTRYTGESGYISDTEDSKVITEKNTAQAREEL